MRKNLLIYVIIVNIFMLITPINCYAGRVTHPDEIHEIHPCVFTGYYPYDNLMEGGYRAYNDEWLEPSNYTCAAPPEIPIGSIITVNGTGSSRDCNTYRVNDRGGKIQVVDGIYHIDILMNSKEQCDRFGIQKGYVTITLNKKEKKCKK